MTDAEGEKIKRSISQNFSNTFIMMNNWIGIKKKIYLQYSLEINHSAILELKSKLVSVSKTPLINLKADIALSKFSKLIDVISTAKLHLPLLVFKSVILEVS